ncbi:hypothetical protein [Gorillibacterium massiliense]|uniref:hypothetical protein n=1 Tax=Gorillibacterium massiliense TaxID=1280390 RepID=UPI0005954903|nr:hypothetical protein [Gorillibacterium massiliense]
MRKYAFTRPSSTSTHDIPKVMIYEIKKSGVYVFVYKSQDDIPSHNDYWFYALDDAEAFCKQYFTINKNDWIQIEDPQEGCQHDLIRPIRRQGNLSDYKYEILIDKEWKEINF